VLVDARFDNSGGRPCGGYDRYSEFQTGQLMQVRNGSGALLAEGRLEACEWVEHQECFNCPGTPNYSTAKPQFTYSVSGVAESSTYIVRIAWKEWSPIPHAEMNAEGWVIHFGVK
jgi:hypothetical protein